MYLELVQLLLKSVDLDRTESVFSGGEPRRDLLKVCDALVVSAEPIAGLLVRMVEPVVDVPGRPGLGLKGRSVMGPPRGLGALLEAGGP
jgi:hypothetical protein